MLPSTLPPTEARSPWSGDIDVATIADRLDIMHRCETEMFAGGEGWGGLMSPPVLERLAAFAGELAAAPTCPAILAGAGTSGRLCRLVSLELASGEYGEPRRILSSLPGGTLALKASKVLGEDGDEEGAQAAERAIASTGGRVVAIGVTCGLSARYVEGFIRTARSAPHQICSAIIGFNPASASKIELFQEGSPSDTYLLNPTIGPEALTGSVRLKSGTATLAMLFALLSGGAPARGVIEERLLGFSSAIERLRLLHGFLGEVVRSAARSFSAGGRLILLGQDNFGALCLFDGAECVPTFGADPDRCRGWPEGGLEGLRCPWDPQRSTHPETLGGDSWLEFEESNLSSIDDRDTLLVVSGDKEGRAAHLIDRLGGRGALFVLACGDRIPGGALRSVRLADAGVVSRQHQLAVVRSALGRLSTSAFAEGGALYENLMVDLRITNRKLFDRAVRLVALLAGLSEKEASGCVTRVVNGGSGGAPATQEQVDAVIVAAAGQRRIVQRAILHSKFPLWPMERVAQFAAEQPVLRRGLPPRV